MSNESIHRKSLYWPSRIGYGVLHIIGSLQVFSYVLGETFFAIGRKIIGRDKLYFWNIIHAIRIYGLYRWFSTSLISFIVAILATATGGLQLKTRGLQDFIINLLAITLVRTIVPLVVSLFILGGAARILSLNAHHLITQPGSKYRAIHLYHMPQLAAIIISAPLLYFYAVTSALLGLLLVSIRLLNLLPMQIYLDLQSILSMHDFVIGIVKTILCGITIAIMQTGYLLLTLKKRHQVSFYSTHFLIAGFLWIVGLIALIETIFFMVIRT